MGMHIDKTEIKPLADELYEQIRDVRRHLHAYPELSYHETETSRFIASELDKAGITYRAIAGTGLLAKIEGTGDLSHCIVLRGDMDALPIQEQTGLPFASCHKGIMHACGHDIHTSCLLGSLILLNRLRDRFDGTVFGIFQPGEELCPGGASLVLAEEPFNNYTVKAFVGLHVATELSTGQVGFRAGKYMASSDEVRIKVIGTGGHAALPHLLTDPVVAAAELITALQQIVSRNADATIPTVLSFGKVIAEGATNVIPKEVYMEGTLRTMDESWRKKALQRINEIAAGVALSHNLEINVDIAHGYPCVVNDRALTEIAVATATEIYTADPIIELPLRMTAEDFGFYTERYPSLFFRIGTASPHLPSGGLHTGTFNPDEACLKPGITLMSALGLEFLNK